MRDRMERFASFPFSISCVSESSIAVGETQPKRTQLPTQTGGGEIQSSVRMKGSSRPNISAGIIQRLIKRLRSLSQLFAAYKEDEDDEVEMEIGLPTDVQHVGHIGCDSKGWDIGGPGLIQTLPALSLTEFEMAMAAQEGDHEHGGPLGA